VPGGVEAINWPADHLPSLVLLDLMMPQVSGFDVLVQLRREARLMTVPVIVITGKELTGDEQALLRDCCADLVQKGFAGDDLLLEAVQKVMPQPQQAAASPGPE
jgi:CheY-like chemotaxis protein